MTPAQWFCRLCRILDTPRAERQPPPRWRSTNERLGHVKPPVETLDPEVVAETVDVEDLPGD